jgi:hypothetical protein
MAAEANLSLLRQSAVVILARQSAMRAVKRRIQREGRIKLSTLTAARIARLTIEYLDQHPELLAEAAASPMPVGRKGKSLFTIHVQDGGQQ